ncbi:MAG TPA: nitroreductase family deazaflavin-dependent oxidoreductase [Acidimicrobiia bacterium]
MSIAHEQKAIGPPRALIRAFWAIHKSIVRLSGGRIGLWRPRAGKRFGVLALETFGRRSGREHSVIIGYFEEGPDLVTLAMNGWADSEPAWWLNLQARPDATVLLPTGPRAVHARAADGEERKRLWAKVDGYPGWGANIDELATRRSMNTTVVVFEPGTAR